MRPTTMINMVMVMIYSAANGNIFSGCLVSPSFNLTVVDRVQDLGFWGFVTASRGSSVMDITLGQSKRSYTEVTLNSTHATATHVGLTSNSLLWQGQVSGKVSPGWRRFFLQVPQRKDTFNLTLTDDHGTTWLGGSLVPFAVEWLSVVVSHFNTSCHTLTPTWHIKSCSVKEVMLPPLLNPLQFTVIGARPLLLMLTLADTNINVTAEIVDTLDAPLPPVPLVLRLTLDHTQPATLPYLVTEDVLGVVEVATGGPVASLRFTSFSDDDLHVVQQLHLSTTTASRQSSLPLPCTSCDHVVPTSPPRPIAVGWPVLLGATAGLLFAGVGLGACTSRLLMTREMPRRAKATTTMAAAAGQTMLVVPYQGGSQEETSSQYEPQYLEPRPVPAPWQATSSLSSPYPSPEHIYEEVVELATTKSTRTPEDSFTSEDDYEYLHFHFR
ncbi:uncharacterized protein LOC135108188 isoform X1 [Scylla paramamosain]|uniref:uncharacterized protein LOC135108188 isoform X1 n=1 Tax=Scylla paramamosain TaxID=85552 RepID=UPI003082FD3B